jgi:NAD(P)-dependent dehydrogenase (short-subunit alcohol dehydrogenase family)
MPTQFDIKGKVIALTGAGQGIGYATTQLLASQGAIVSMADVNEKTLNTAAEEFTKAGGTVMATVVDVRSEDSVNDWIKKTVEKFGKLDGAVNLAGVVPECINRERVEEHNTPDWKLVMDINLTGVFFCMRAQLQQMNPQGSIVNASSLCGGIGEMPYLALLHSDSILWSQCLYKID